MPTRLERKMFEEKTKILIDNNDVSKQDRNHDKKVFYQAMKERGFDFEDIDDETRLPKSLIPVVAQKIEPFVLFNSAILDLHKNKIVSITDAISYLVEDYFDPKEVLRILQTVTLNYVQNDLGAKYNMNKQEEVKKMNHFIY